MAVFISREQVARSLEAIKNLHPFFGMSFLAFKKNEIPINKTREVNFSLIAQ